MTDLASCPFCGSDRWIKRESCQKAVAFQCKNCGMSTRWGSIGSVVSDLNKRHDPYMPDWSKAPDGAVWHAIDGDGIGFWYLCDSLYIEHNEWFEHKIDYFEDYNPEDYDHNGFLKSQVLSGNNIEGGCPEFYMTLRRRPV